MSSLPAPSRIPFRILLLASTLLLVAASAQAQPIFSKQFVPDTIGSGSTSLLTFTIDNAAASPVTDLAFTDVLPAGVNIASPGVPDTSCPGGVVMAPDGGGTITFSGGSVGGVSSCTVTVQVTSSMIGTHMNVSSDLTSSAGNSGNAADVLSVVTSRPGFSKSFSPASGPFGIRSTLTFLIDNSANGGFASGVSFTDVLPTGMVIASPSNASTDCTGAALTATEGTDTISIFGGLLLAGTTCTVSVDVVAESPGELHNSSGTLSSTPGGPSLPSGFATATFTATVTELALIKSILGDPVSPGATVDLEFRILNRNATTDATGVTFTDDLDATLSGLAPSGPLPAAPCGGGSSLAFAGGVLTLSNGSLPARSECSFGVTLLVPAGSAAGAYPNTTSAITGDIGGPVVGNMASDTLFVSDAPVLTKTFLTDPVGASSTVTVEFTLQNISSTSSATDIAFQDNITQFLSSASVTAIPASGFCGAGSTAFTAFVTGELVFMVSGANLAPSDSCTFTVDLFIPGGTPAGTYTNTTSEVTATVGGVARIGPSAADDLTVVAGPRLTKTFTDDPVLPGGTVTLEFTLEHDATAPTDATSINFSDDLNATLTGLSAVGLPMNDVCGMGSAIAGTTNLVLTGGILAAGDSCTFSVTLDVPAAATPGDYVNTTSVVTSTVSGVSTTSNAAGDTLTVSGLEFTKEFIDDPAIAGGTATLRFTITNNGAADATGMFFTDNLSAVISGMAVSGPLPATPCGAGSTISGTTSLVFSGGNLLAGNSCLFDVTVSIPAATVDGVYGNATSDLTGTVGGSGFTLPPAFDGLQVNSSLIEMTKSFTDDPVQPGDPVTLEFALTNLGSQPISSIAFTDDLGAALTGLSLSSIGPDSCGFAVVGTTNLSFSGGSLAALGSCTVQLTLTVPPGASPGSYLNTTSLVTGDAGGLSVNGAVASDSLLVVAASFSKAFDGPTVAGGTAVLTFTIENLDAAAGLSALAFNDDLDAVVPGLVAVGLPMNNVCGTGSQVSGTDFLTFTGGDLPASGTCSFPITVQVPAGATAGVFPNVTSVLSSSGLEVSSPASDDLEIEPPPTFAKVFAPNSVGLGQVSTLTFTLDNSASVLAASSLAFTDNLPAGTAVATPPSATNSCGGSVTAVTGSGTISLSGGSVGAGASCTISVDVEGTTVGGHINTTGDLTSSSGNSGTATDTLVVVPQPTFTKAFAPMVIASGDTSTLTFTVDNTASALAASSLAFTDNLPAAVTVAAVPNVVNGCGGAVTAVGGSGVISLNGGSVGAGAACTLSVDVTSTTVGDHVNLTGDLSSSQGDSGPATATLTVAASPTFAKAFAPTAIPAGGVSTLTFTIDNSASTLAASSLDFTDNLPASVVVATPSNGATTCTGGTLTAADGSGTIAYTGGTVAAMSSCTVTVDVTSATVGDHVNSTGDLTSSLGNSGPATATLTVVPPPTFAKAFAPAAIPAGGVSTLTFTIDNSASTLAASSLDFTDNLPASVVLATPSNGATTCTGGTLTAVDGSGTITYTGGTVAASASCTVTVDVTSSTFGDHVNLTGDLTSSLGNSGTATDTLSVVIPELELSKTFQSNPVLPGGFVDVEYTLTNLSSVLMVTGLTFTDDLDAALTGLAATTLPGADPCGAGSTVTGTSVLTLANGSLAPSGSCTFTVTLRVPVDASAGAYPGATSQVDGTSGGAPVMAPPATDTLDVAFLDFVKFFDGPATAGGEAILTFVLTNPDPVNDATGLTFSDDLDSVLPGLAAVGLPANDVCGAGSQVSGTSVIQLVGGIVAAGDSCTFDVTVAIPDGAPTGTVTNVTSVLEGDVGSSAVVVNPAAAEADLEIAGTPVAIPVDAPWALLALVLLMGLLALRQIRLG